ncbi:MAG: phage tail tape measure protein [Chloroflexi bacterium]|nr:phage tail tape measure protein [Chloroflexota bacterium]
MAQRISILVALEGADEGLKRAITSAERSLGELATTAKTAGDKAAAGMAEVKAGMSAFSEQVASAKTQLLAFLSINWAAGKAQEVIQIADAWAMMSARLKLATAGQQEFTTAQRELFAIAQRIGVPIQETATLYGRLQQAVRMLGGEQKDALAITESISQALRLSGASATEAQSALLQFGQALASGVLRGEEFNSVVENSPRLAKALADGLDVPIGRLRKMAEEGRLTADVVVNALMSQKDKLATEYAQLPATVSQSFQRLQNAFGEWVSQVDQSTGTTKKLAEALTWLSQNLDTVMQWLKRIAEAGLAVLAYRLSPALITAWQAAGAAAVAAANGATAAWASVNLSVSNAVASIGVLRATFAVLGAFLAGWEIGTWLSEKFEFVRKTGIAMVEVLMRGIEELRYRWEMFAALFTSDTVAQATQRHQARLAEMNQVFAQMYADAGKGTAAATGAMNTAASVAEEIARRLEAVRQGTQEAVARGVEAVHAALEKLKSRLGEVEQAVGKASQTVDDATAKMAEAYKGLTAILDANLQRQVDAVKARYQQEVSALEATGQAEATRISQSTQLLTESLTQQTGLRRQALTEAMALIDQESAARIDAARRQGQTDAERSANVQRVENEILAAKRQTMTQALAEYRSHIDALNAEANRHLAEVNRIEQEKRRLSMSTEERIRDIQRQGMSEYEATEDRKSQIAEYQEQARRALANGSFEDARSFAQKSMDLAAQVAASETSEARRAEDARRQAEQGATQIAALEARAREASRNQEYGKSEALMRQADALRAEISQRTQEADAAIARGKEGVNTAVQKIKSSEEILTQTLDAEANAHRTAAQSAMSARDQIKQTLTETQTQVDQLTAKLAQGLKVTIDADASRFTQALADLDKALAEKKLLVSIQADLQQAEKQLREYEQLLKEGKTLPINADVGKARDALDKLRTYADQNALLELRVTTEKAQASITNVDGMIRALERIQTESRHQVNANVDTVRSQIQSLNGANTSSTHTITVRRIEGNATGGLVGAGARQGTGVRQFADGGSVASAFPRMAGGSVPGSGHSDTVPRTLESGAFVLRKAAVRKYGGGALSRLANGVARFALGGPVAKSSAARKADQERPSEDRDRGRPTPPKRNREAIEALKLIELGLRGMDEYTLWLERTYSGGVSLDMRYKTMERYRAEAAKDRDTVQALMGRNQLTGNERGHMARIQQTWRSAMAQPLAFGKDLERELVSYMEQTEARGFAEGGPAASDSVPAMLTPGEYVVNRAAVARFGSGFFAALNSLALPAGAVAARVQGYASGGLVGLGPPTLSLTRPVLEANTAPTRTVRVELAAGDRRVNATIDAGDESRLLQILEVARARAA